jgi:hypothetical protein
MLSLNPTKNKSYDNCSSLFSKPPKKILSRSDGAASRTFIISASEVNQIDYEKFHKVKVIKLQNDCLVPTIFSQILKKIISIPDIKELHLSKSAITSEQLLELQVLAIDNKKMRIVDIDGEKFGAAYMNWHQYNMEKKNISPNLHDMRTTTREALEHFRQDFNRLPNFICDFGAGTGACTIPLLNQGCPKVWAIDADKEALKMLVANTLPQYHPNLTCIHSPFKDLQLQDEVELLIASFTWPYRQPKDFPSVWKKCVNLVKKEGYIAGHFFGSVSNKQKDPCITYHTEEELRELLNDNFEIKFFQKEPEGTDFKIFGGDKPAWGDLFHVVAKKTK